MATESCETFAWGHDFRAQFVLASASRSFDANLDVPTFQLEAITPNLIVRPAERRRIVEAARFSGELHHILPPKPNYRVIVGRDYQIQVTVILVVVSSHKDSSAIPVS